MAQKYFEESRKAGAWLSAKQADRGGYDIPALATVKKYFGNFANFQNEVIERFGDFTKENN